MKILVQVIVPSVSDIRNDIPNWDVYGMAQALDDEMTVFSVENFYNPINGRIGTSVKDSRFSWQVDIIQGSIPSIVFWNHDEQTEISRITKTPVATGEVKSKINSILNPTKIVTYALLGAGLLGVLYFIYKYSSKKKRITAKR